MTIPSKNLQVHFKNYMHLNIKKNDDISNITTIRSIIVFKAKKDLSYVKERFPVFFNQFINKLQKI